MIIRNCMLCWPDYCARGTLSGGSWRASLPASNLQTDYLGQVARTTDAQDGSGAVRLAFDKRREVRAVALVNHNLSLDATIRHILYEDAACTSVAYDSKALPVWPRWYDSVSRRWSTPGWWKGQISEEELARIERPLHFRLLEATLAGKAMDVILSDPGNSSGHLQAGRLVVVEDWTPRINFSYGARLRWVDPSATTIVGSGTRHFQRKTKYRRAEISLKAMRHEEAVNKFLRMQRECGISEPFLFIFNSGDEQYLQQTAFLARFADTASIGFDAPGLASSDTIVIEEVV
ncbi:hypothetical protein NNJEOMEG_03303 [Fundidesulfovibrio magnetotacticus]|uniref:Uncharacterized protein n=1 Tax=Fundidesulfovibrio magnetotacticus TaxID=2730080 RepID=A0A6V8LX22_9BACT|nr:hypothetical protein [Fundidesulfovibrio magnetotacticus]GFK95440.1 hypothetical protein NNJEOMEG_03303 [Fundidesulfovibrio magnetotacticus]